MIPDWGNVLCYKICRLYCIMNSWRKEERISRTLVLIGREIPFLGTDNISLDVLPSPYFQPWTFLQTYTTKIVFREEILKRLILVIDFRYYYRTNVAYPNYIQFTIILMITCQLVFSILKNAVDFTQQKRWVLRHSFQIQRFLETIQSMGYKTQHLPDGTYLSF